MEKGQISASSSSTDTQNLNLQVGPLVIEDIGQKLGEIFDEFTKDITLRW